MKKKQTKKTAPKPAPKKPVTPDIAPVTSPLLYGERLAAEYLGTSRSYLAKARSEGAPGNRTPGPVFVRIGGRCMYRRSDLDSWVAGLDAQRTI